MAEHPRTDAGRFLLAQKANFCDWVSWDEKLPEAILGIEDEARRAFLDELIAFGAVGGGPQYLSYNELDEALSRHRLRVIAELERRRSLAPSGVGNHDE